MNKVKIKMKNSKYTQEFRDSNYCVDVRENVKYLDSKVGILTKFQ